MPPSHPPQNKVKLGQCACDHSSKQPVGCLTRGWVSRIECNKLDAPITLHFFQNQNTQRYTTTWEIQNNKKKTHNKHTTLSTENAHSIQSSVWGEIVGGHNRRSKSPSVSKSNRRLQAGFSLFTDSRYIPQIPLKRPVIFPEIWNFNWLLLFKLDRFICN